MLVVSSEDTQIVYSVKFLSFPPEFPVSETLQIDFDFATSSARITLGELPLQKCLMATSPSLPNTSS
jgi:hypothetical protein